MTEAHSVAFRSSMLTLSSEEIDAHSADATTEVSVTNPSESIGEAWSQGNFRHDGFKDDTNIW